MKFLLISKEAAEIVEQALQLGLEMQHDNYYYEKFKEALHTLESGLHTTDCIPSDYIKEPW